MASQQRQTTALAMVKHQPAARWGGPDPHLGVQDTTGKVVSAFHTPERPPPFPSASPPPPISSAVNETFKILHGVFILRLKLRMVIKPHVCYVTNDNARSSAVILKRLWILFHFGAVGALNIQKRLSSTFQGTM